MRQRFFLFVNFRSPYVRMSLRRAFNVFLFASISDVRSGIRFQIVRVISVKGFTNVHSGVANHFIRNLYRHHFAEHREREFSSL